MSRLYLSNPCASYHYFRTRCCGRSQRPAFPAPSSKEREDGMAKTRANHAAGMRAHVSPSLRRFLHSSCPGLVPGIHVSSVRVANTWMAGTRPAMTTGDAKHRLGRPAPGLHRACGLRLPPSAVAARPVLLSIAAFPGREKPIMVAASLHESEASY